MKSKSKCYGDSGDLATFTSVSTARARPSSRAGPAILEFQLISRRYAVKYATAELWRVIAAVRE